MCDFLFDAKWDVYPVRVAICDFAHVGPVLKFSEPISGDILELYCDICGQPYLDPQEWLVAFRFHESFRSQVIKKKMTLRQKLPFREEATRFLSGTCLPGDGYETKEE